MDINEAFIATMGFSTQEIVGRPIHENGFSSASATQHLAERLAAGESVRGAEYRVQKKDGATLDCLVSAELVVINEQNCVLIAWLDITERKRSEVELVVAIETVMKDASWFSKTLIEKLANVRNPDGARQGGELNDLTARERDVFDALCEGRSDKDTAMHLNLALNTVRNHVATIYAKLDVHSRGELILWAQEHGYFVARPTRAKKS